MSPRGPRTARDARRRARRPRARTLAGVVNDGAKLPLRGLRCRGRRQSHHEHLRARGRHALDDVTRGQVRSEIGDAETAAGGQHRRAECADFMAVARRGRKQQPRGRIRGARAAGGTNRGCAGSRRTSGAPARRWRARDAIHRRPARARASAHRAEGPVDAAPPPGARSPGRSPSRRRPAARR